jgi:AcrR family transcriptional regulator
LERDRRTEVLDAALACFLAKGYASTTIADIRKASGATTGSIYHFFEGKEALAAALFQRAVLGWAAASAPSSGDATSAEFEIRASVTSLVAWGEKQPDLFRFMDECRFLGRAGGSELTAILDAGAASAADRFQSYVNAGEVRAMGWPIARALILGPAYEYLRQVTSGAAEASGDAATRLADAAWSAVARLPS